MQTRSTKEQPPNRGLFTSVLPFRAYISVRLPLCAAKAVRVYVCVSKPVYRALYICCDLSCFKLCDPSHVTTCGLVC